MTHYYGHYDVGSTYQRTIFGNVFQFFERLGVYDTILPFLLVFTIVFAVFERTKVLGTEEFGGAKTTKKNLNAMVAFVTSFLVIASSKLVAIINESLGNIVILLLVSICFLVLVGTFYKESEDVYLKEGPWRTMFMVIMFIGVLLIFLHAIKMDNGQPFLYFMWDYLLYNITSTAVSALVLVIVVLFFMFIIVKEPKAAKGKKEEHH